MNIIQLSPAGKDYLWGGTRLRTEYHKHPECNPLAETWECSVHPDGASMVISGEFAGKSLADVIAMHPEYLGGKYRNQKKFPILVKFIDAAQDLSVQVHPNDNYAQIHEQENGKTEMWYIMDAVENASLIYGFQKNYSRQEIRTAIARHEILDYLQKIPVHKGDVFFIPAGTVHAIGKGILLAEIQENSNLTYRVYDYDRTDQNGQRRQLHIEKALDVMQLQPADSRNFVNSENSKNSENIAIRTLCECDYFKTDKIDLDDSRDFDFCVHPDSFQVLLCLDGNAILTHPQGCDTETIRIRKGDCLFLPANAGQCNLTGDAEFLKVIC
ncbi:MAG: class I mannose-6-phosphate isomerase [Oscillospiraceae bacterium]|nr:class I mannose-6-phosphate isomerase [Oscillospiraceae bacterium]